MATYKEIQAQIAALQKQGDDVRKAEIQDALTKVRELISEHGLTIADIGKRAFAAAGNSVKAGKKKTAVVKYRDASTGSTWSGIGPRPKWIKKAFEEGRADEYLVDERASAPLKKAAAKKASAKKPAARKPAAKTPAAAAKKSAAAKKVVSQ